MERVTQEISMCLGHAHFLSLNSDNVFEDHPHYELKRLLVNNEYFSSIDLTWDSSSPDSSDLSRLEFEYFVLSKAIKDIQQCINDVGIDGDLYLTLKSDFDQHLIDISIIERQITTLRES
jgi:hypothetical protein|tara:strand:+ start:2998 stop:3357 length:360 start_codon:yes stop_codon:yes gene_type:complete